MWKKYHKTQGETYKVNKEKYSLVRRALLNFKTLIFDARKVAGSATYKHV